MGWINDVPRHTAKQVSDDVLTGMDPDVETVPAQYYDRLAAELTAANATLDRLREAVPEVLPPHISWRDALDGARDILYPKETEHGN